MKPCPPGKERNPKTNRCVKECADGYVRNADFKCIQEKIPAASASVFGITSSITSLLPVGTREQPKLDIDDRIVYNYDGTLTEDDYKGYKNQVLRDIYSVLTSKPTGRKYIYGLGNRPILINAILNKQDELRKENKQPTLQESKYASVEMELPSDSIEQILSAREELSDAERNKVVMPEVPDDLEKIDDNYVNNMGQKIPSFILDKDVGDADFENDLGAVPDDVESGDYNEYMRKKEIYESRNIENLPELYPTLDDPEFSVKIANKQEFADTRYRDGAGDIEEEAKKYENAEFELSPNQLFVKNFMAAETPYKGLLLYHGVGTGKTCSAIGVAEETRRYNKQNNIRQRIIIVASPNVQKSFMSQLFNESRLEKVDGYWNIQACVSKQLIDEVNPTNTKDVEKDVIVRQIQNLIKTSYLFMGYVEFSRYMQKTMTIEDETANAADKKRREIQAIQKTFDNRLVIVDEAHNIRTTPDNKKKQIGNLFLRVAKHSRNMKIVLLSATPMYNSQTEIVWMTNLLNANDGRSTIKESDVFVNDELRETPLVEGQENGRQLLERKLTGYVSFVRGENPYSFPFRIYPGVFDSQKVITDYPTVQFNGIEITDPLKYTEVYPHKMRGHQLETYKYVIESLKGSEKINMENMQTFGYTLLLKPIEANVIAYPTKSRVGRDGFAETMDFKMETIRRDENVLMMKHQYSYKEDIVKKYGRIFSKKVLRDYSAKISSICDTVKNSTGIVLIYSQFIDSGIVPMALALEEMGFGRFSTTAGVKSLFKTAPVDGIDSIEMVQREAMVRPANYRQAKYAIITGDPYLSHNNAADLDRIVKEDNSRGEHVKVILISKAAAEGLDFKNIRQVHVIDPWYNMNRIEQIIGRAVRFRSHVSLPFRERNVEIYLHSCHDSERETADMYMYRLAETKAVQIGEITRILKEVSVDCHLNIAQSELTAEKLASMTTRKIEIELSSGATVEFQPGDSPFTQMCDYKDNCQYVCKHTDKFNPAEREKSTYGIQFARMHYDAISRRVRQAFKESHVLTQADLVAAINLKQTYPREQIFYVLSQMIDDGGEIITDKYGRRGTIVNRDKYYAFQPIEINDEHIPVYERAVPVEYKRDSIVFQGDLSKEDALPEKEVDNSIQYNEIAKVAASILERINETLPNNAVTSKSDWYDYASTESTQDILLSKHAIPRDFFVQSVLRHYIDELSGDDKILVASRVHSISGGADQYSTFEFVMAKYMEEHTVTVENQNAIVFNDGKKYRLMMVEGDELRTAHATDYEAFKMPVAQHFLIQHADIFPEFGFIVTTPRFAFKLKSMGDKYNNRGARCSQATKNDTIARLRCIMNGGYCKTPFDDDKQESAEHYTDEAMKDISKQSICVVAEVLMRYMDSIRHRGKRYFMDPEDALVNQAEKI